MSHPVGAFLLGEVARHVGPEYRPARVIWARVVHDYGEVRRETVQRALHELEAAGSIEAVREGRTDAWGWRLVA